MRGLAVALAILTLSFSGSALADDLSKPIKVSADGHSLATPDGEPFFWLADTAWELPTRLTREEADAYLRDRAAKGFTVVQFVAAAGPLGGRDGLKTPNLYGETPFFGDDLTRPNPRYFDHVAWIVDRARAHGIRSAILPFFGINEVSFKPGQVTPQAAEDYGRWLAARLAGKGVLWVLGGDTNPIWPSAPARSGRPAGEPLYRAPVILADYRNIYDAFARGIAAGEGDDPFITYHPTNFTFLGTAEPRTSLFFGDRSWLDMNMLQTSHFLNAADHVASLGGVGGWDAARGHEPVAAEYASTPTRPVVDGEPLFEDLAIDLKPDGSRGYWTGDDARAAAFRAVFAGAAGHTYGHHAIWQFYRADKGLYQLPPKVSWREALDRPVASQLRHLRALMLSRPYFSRIPDSSLVLGGVGDADSHIGALRDREGRYIMVYSPRGQAFTVDMARLSGGAAKGWWFDPRTGRATRIAGLLSGRAPKRFLPPTRGVGADWVLVLDDARTDFGPPGSGPAG